MTTRTWFVGLCARSAKSGDITYLEADNGAAALRVAHNESPDLVLLDVRLPDLSGIEVLEQLKKTGDARAVIMITADPQLDDVKTALKLGAYDFVGKPLDFDELARRHQERARGHQPAHRGRDAARRGAPPSPATTTWSASRRR